MDLLDPLVSVEWLAKNISRQEIKLLDGTWQMPGDTAPLPDGFIPGAQVFDIDAIADQASPLTHMLPSAETFAKAVSDMGIHNDDWIIAYDRIGVFTSPRLWWTFQMFGHANVAVLDGGLPAWIAAGHDVSTSQSKPEKHSNYTPKAPLIGVITQSEILSELSSPHLQILDARPLGRFTGKDPEPRDGMRSGRIPGSQSLPYGNQLSETRHLKPLTELAKQVNATGVDLERPIITSCGSGITAAGLALNLRRMGAQNIRVYDGSWAEWGAGNSPIETGEIPLREATQFAHLGRPEPGLATAVNPNISRASTLLFDKAEDLYRTDLRSYGRHGSEVHDALKEAFNTLEGGAGTSLTPSGFSACTLAVLSQVKAGDHLLLTDSVYGPTRGFCQHYLNKMGVETELYDPNIGAGIADLVRDNTSVIFLESPGSLTFEIQDVPAICSVAKSRKISTIIDNTWSGGLSFKPFLHGVDISIHAATKYIGGHSDIMFGAVISRKEHLAKQVDNTRKALGFATSPDDAYQILRGFRSLSTRFWAQEKSADELARWLSEQDQVAQVLHPALPDHPSHDLWKRDFTGGACLFGAVLEPCSDAKVLDFINRLKLFGVGFSYGGYESVAIHCDPQLRRKFGEKFAGPLVRFGCGLEDVEDLKSDVKQALNGAF
jgi:cystathionine beta-lyase